MLVKESKVKALLKLVIDATRYDFHFIIY